jgi:amino acid adenylation domain-containing protein
VTGAAELLDELRRRGVHVWSDDGERLHYRVNAGGMTPELRSELLERKSELVAILRGRGEPPPPMIASRESDASAPLSFSQQRLWFLDQLQPGNAFYNVPLVTRFVSRVDVAVFQRALDAVVARHATLRTRFTATGGVPEQVVEPSATVPVRVEDLRDVPRAVLDAEATRVASGEVAIAFDITQAPLARALLVRLRDAEWMLVVTMHHIVCDGWSLGILWRELTALYAAFAAGRRSPLPELPIQYADYAAWQREWLAGAALEQEVAWWERRLADAPALELPTDRRRPALQSFAGGSVAVAVPAELTERLRAFAAAEHATMYMVGLAAFLCVLSRYSGQDDVLVGTFIAGRTRSELEGLIGYFVNTLVLRGDVRGDRSFRDVLAGVREMTLDAYAHQDVPFEMLVDRLAPERDLSRNPLFQTSFQLLDFSETARPQQATRERAPAERDTPAIAIERATAALDLALGLWVTPQGLAGALEYSADLFEPATVERIAAHFLRLLAGIVERPEMPISQIPLLDPAERQYLAHDLNATRVDYPLERSLIERFETQASRTPTATAFVCDGQELTYESLDGRAGRLATRLRALGLEREAIVGVCLERSLAAPVALLAVLKAGGAYLPLDASYPPERIAYMLNDARAAAVITDRDHAPLVEPAGCPVLLVEHDEEGTGFPEPGVRAAPRDLAYVIYTSGSTGSPKGVAVEHAQIVNRLCWMWEAYPFAPGEVGAQKTALSFVDSLWELLGPLLCGVRTVIVADATVREPWELVDVLADHCVTRLWLVPSQLEQLLLTVPDLGERLPALRSWVLSGEALSAALHHRFTEVVPNATLYNLYGTSEVWDATWWDPAVDPAGEGTVPIGRPIANVRAVVLDRWLQVVPVGVVGELCIGGVGLARGYLHRPELTAQRFVADPEWPGERLYRTGDLARVRGDGVIEFLGRADQQVKLRGHRIELGEIEAGAVTHPDVEQAAAVVVGEEADRRLVVHVVPADGRRAPDTATLRAHLAKRLPGFMLPNAVVGMEQLPLTPSGKVDRRQLAEARATPEDAVSAHEPPRTAVERALAEIWADVLERHTIGRHDDFFELGGHSLLAARIVARARDALNTELPLRDLFEAPTIAELAARLDATQQRGLDRPPLVPRPRIPIARST